MIPQYAQAAWFTLALSAIGIAASVVIGFFCALVQYYKIPVLSRIVAIYIELSRNTPLLIQLFLLHFGLKIEAYLAAVIGLTFLGGSYMAEAFRGGLDAIDKVQTESSYSLGMTRAQTMRHVLLPQALIVATPALGANIIFLLKETSVVSIIGLTDLVAEAKNVISIWYMTNEALFMLVIAYLILIAPIAFLIFILERKLRYASFGR